MATTLQGIHPTVQAHVRAALGRLPPGTDVETALGDEPVVVRICAGGMGWVRLMPGLDNPIVTIFWRWSAIGGVGLEERPLHNGVANPFGSAELKVYDMSTSRVIARGRTDDPVISHLFSQILGALAGPG